MREIDAGARAPRWTSVVKPRMVKWTLLWLIVVSVWGGWHVCHYSNSSRSVGYEREWVFQVLSFAFLPGMLLLLVLLIGLWVTYESSKR